MLWCVELRAPDPYCPIDLSYEGGEIVVSEAESIARPLRLGVDEASALLVALRMLVEVAPAGSSAAQPDDREAGGGGGGGRRGQRASPGAGGQGRADDVLAPDPGSHRAAAAAPPALLRARAGTRPPSGTSIRCGCWWWRAAPTWRAGAAGPRGCGCSGWTGCWACRCSTCRPRCRPTPSRWTWTGGCSGRPRRTSASSSSSARRALGRRVLPVRERAAKRRRTAARHAAHAGYALGAPARPAAGRGRPGRRPRRTRRPGRRGCGRRAGPVRVLPASDRRAR